MKKLGVILLTIFLIVSLTACVNQYNNDSVLTTVTKANDMANSNNETIRFSGEITSTDSHEENIGGNDVVSCNHIWEYHGIDSFYLNYVEERAPGWTDKFSDMFIKTEDFNLRVFADYFGISKVVLSRIVSQEIIDFKIAEGVYSKADDIELWYTDNYSINRNFLVDDNPAPDSGSVMIRPENDTIHIDRYFTIHKSLIVFVGEERFEEFKELYGGTDGFNVLNFIDYFHISRERFANIMEEQRKTSSYIYNVDYVYGTEEQQKIYFEKHIIEVKE